MIRIITFHNIDAIHFDWFKKTIYSINKYIGFADPSENDLLNQKNKVLLSFDDGYKSNKLIADQILAKLNIKALFFITHDFIGLKPDNAFNFAQKNFFPTRQISRNDGDITAMSWDDVRSLHEENHVIGAHTLTHPNLKLLNSFHDKHDEIVKSKNKIECKINNNIDLFAYPFGNLSSVDKESVDIAKKNFKYCFSNIRGSVKSSPSKYFIYRQNIVPGSSYLKSVFTLFGMLNIKYFNTRKEASNKLI